MYATEDTLNLLSSRGLSQLLGRLSAPGYTCRFRRVRWLGIASNLILVINKP
jgi:hypothetical protein